MIGLAFLRANWQIVAVVGVLLIAGATIGVTRFQLNSCRAKVAEFEAAYRILSRSVQVQNDAVEELEKKRAAAASRAAQARAEAAKGIAAAKQRADALAALLAAPRAMSECPAGDAIVAVRDDLRSQHRTP